MKRLSIYILLLVFAITLSSWGFYAHKQINRLAVFTLPQDMIRFYKSNIDYITEQAVGPDKRRYADTAEAPRHYLDAELYEGHIDSIPEHWEDAVEKYGNARLNKDGILPWHIQKSYYRLVNAFKERDSLRILKYSADLGHYIADAHVPLHTTENHNGQLSNQVGIHAFWESRLPELFSIKYNYLTGRAKYINNPLKEAWKIIKQSHKLVDTVLLLEAQLSSSFPSDRKYSFSERNNIITRQYSKEYSKAYHDRMHGMVEQQMRASILATGSYWYSAWIDAGQPVLQNLPKKEFTIRERKALSDEEKKFKEGKIIGREP